MSNSLFRIETRTSQSLAVKDVQVRLHSQVIQLRLPFANGGLIWNQPVAVLIQTVDGRYQTLPIHDVTRTIVLVLSALCVSTFLLTLFRRKTA